MKTPDVKSIMTEADAGIRTAKNLEELNAVFNKGNSEISLILRSLKNLPESKRAKIGKEANEAKRFLEEKVREKKISFINTASEDWFDITAPGKKPLVGHLHPLTMVKRKVEEIFQTMGFSVVEGPEIETEHYNFDALNIPKNHPARDMWDTFYLKNGMLLRTHTSPVQIRHMEKNNPPLRIIAPGRIYRHEATDASHECNFYQFEGLMIDKNISVANFKFVIQEFFQKFFGKEVKIRLRPSFFPFTEPSFEVDMSCVVCGGKGCPTCSHGGWIELMGAGMVHPNVLKASGLIPHQFSGSGWQGFAFGGGLDRLTMMKYKISDIRLLYSGDLRFLKQF
jgi:phenylalanyl-tRNA synthetase alpha chain